MTGLGFINNELYIIVKESGIFLTNLFHKLSDNEKINLFRDIINDKKLWESKCLKVREFDFIDGFGNIEEISDILINEVNLDENDIDKFMKARRYECFKINYEMKFGSPEEIALSKMYSYLYYKRR